MRIKFITDDGHYKAGSVYEMGDSRALQFIQKGVARVYKGKLEKAIIK